MGDSMREALRGPCTHDNPKLIDTTDFSIAHEVVIETRSIAGGHDAFLPSRYETFWLGFMNDELALSPETLVVGHGTAADAVLRYIENHEARRGSVNVSLGIPRYAYEQRH